MMIIFQCFGGTHTSVAAASIYLGRLPRTRKPRLQEVLALPYFDRVDNCRTGTLNYLGRDRRHNPVFVLGSGRWRAEVRAVLSLFHRICEPDKVPVALIDCFPEATWPVRLGGFLSRRLGLTAPGRPLVGRGILQGYPRYVKLVERFEEDPAPYLLQRST